MHASCSIFSAGARGDNPRDDDILSSDYGFRCPPIFAPAESTHVRERFNKHLMHLTFSRVHLPPQDKLWPVERIFPPIQSACVAFIDHLLSSSISWQQGERAKWEDLRRGIDTKVISVEATANVYYPSTHKIQAAFLKDV